MRKDGRGRRGTGSRHSRSGARACTQLTWMHDATEMGTGSHRNATAFAMHPVPRVVAILVWCGRPRLPQNKIASVASTPIRSRQDLASQGGLGSGLREAGRKPVPDSVPNGYFRTQRRPHLALKALRILAPTCPTQRKRRRASRGKSEQTMCAEGTPDIILESGEFRGNRET